MNTPSRFPIYDQDENVFDSLSKKIGSYATIAANLPKDFPQLFRHAGEFGAKCFGSTSRQRLFAEVKSTPPIVASNVTRQDIARQLEVAIKRGADKLADEGNVSLEQAKAIADAAPAIVQAVSKDLQYLAVDRVTFERTVLDPILLAARAPKFEYAITSDLRAAFIFDAARRALREAAGQDSRVAIGKVKPEEVQQILRNSLFPLLDAVKQRQLPLTHVPIVLSDKDGNVVGVSFQHPVHEGVVPVCCEDEQRFWAVAAALYTGEVAQSKRGADWAVGYADPTSIRPYFPTRSFPSMFNSTEDDNGPSIYFAQVSVDTAIAYLSDLTKAVNGRRVQCKESNPLLLKSASLNSTEIISAGSQTSRTYWGLLSYQSQFGQSKVMSASGTTQGILINGRWADQYYLRQIYWLDESSFPELGMPSDHFLAPSHKVDITKIIPENIEDFTRRALERVNRLSKEQKRDSAIQEAALKLQEQKRRLQQVKCALEAEQQARVAAREAGLAAIGPEVLPPV